MEISKLVLSDIKEIEKIEKDNFSDFEAYSSQQLKDCIKDKNYLFLKLLDKNKIIGFCICNLLVDHIDLCQIVIDKQYQNKGYASRFVDYLLTFHLPIYVEVNEVNKAAISFYQKNGFKLISIRAHYYKDNNGIVMLKQSLK